MAGRVANAILAVAAGLSAPVGAAQESQPYSEALADSATQVRERMLRDATIDRRGPRRTGRAAVSARTRRTCAHRREVAARYGRDHADIRRLYALCARAGL